MRIMLINEDTKKIELTCRKLPKENVYKVVAKLKNKETRLAKNRRVKKALNKLIQKGVLK